MRSGIFSMIVVVLGICALTIAGCSETDTDTNEQDNFDEEETLFMLDPEVTEVNTNFGFELFKEIAADPSQENIFISPLSVAMALAMTLNGAANETYDGMLDALGIETFDLQKINEGFAALRQNLLNSDPKVELAIANSIWMRKGTGFREDFLERNRIYYKAKLAELDFSSPDAADTINAWVSENTKGKIDKMVDRIDPLSVMFLLNATYFKGQWQEKFDEGETQERDFRLKDGSTVRVPMMHRTGEIAHLDGDGFQAIKLPYGDGSFNMYVFLPDGDLDAFIQEIDAEKWNNWMSQFAVSKGSVTLPKFKMEYEIRLNDALKAMGMALAFDPARADFSSMRPIPPNLYIQQVKHKTFVEVNEEGTEAAGATMVEITLTAVMPTFSFVADKPFLFAIRDDKTGTLLFIGTVDDPS